MSLRVKINVITIHREDNNTTLIISTFYVVLDMHICIRQCNNNREAFQLIVLQLVCREILKGRLTPQEPRRPETAVDLIFGNWEYALFKQLHTAILAGVVVARPANFFTPLQQPEVGFPWPDIRYPTH